MSTKLKTKLGSLLRCLPIWIATYLLFALAVNPARADTIVFDESSGPLTVFGSSRLTSVSCLPFVLGDSCTAILVGPSGTFLAGTGGGLFPAGDAEGIVEPEFPPLAEEGFLGNNALIGNSQVKLEFVDYFIPITGFICPDGCPITEDGTFQQLGTILWHDGTRDTIQFHGEVPEPSASILLITVLVGISVIVRQKRRSTSGH